MELINVNQVLNKKVLIVCFSFPPYPGTGGRRWLKFSKELIKSGYELFVIGAKNNTSKTSAWEKEASTLNLKYFPIKNNYSAYSNKWLFKLKSLYLKSFTSKNYFDQAVLWIKPAGKKIKELIKTNQINNVIISLPPFSLTALAPEIRKVSEYINIIVDVRDAYEFYIKGLNLVAQKKVYDSINQHLSFANHIITVNNYFTEEYKNRVEAKNISFKTIFNAYDKKDYETVEALNISVGNEKKIKIVYTGNLIPECRIYVNAFINLVLHLKKNNQSLFSLIEIKIYGNVDSEIERQLEKHELNDKIKFFGHVSIETALKEVRTADFCLIFPADFYYKYSLESKFFEYTFFRKRIITFPENGFCSDLITKHQLGKAFKTEHDELAFETLLTQYNNNQHYYNSDYDIEQFSLENTTNNLKQLFI